MAATTTFDVVVIGGGLAGLSVAHHLVNEGARTLLVDRHDVGRATDAGAGILSPETTKNVDPSWVELVLACGEHYRRLTSDLEAQGLPTGYAQCGLLTLALAEWDVDAYQEAADVVLHRRERRQAPSADRLGEIDAGEARARFPALGPVTRALWNAEAARVDGRSMAAAVGRTATVNGLVIRRAAANQIVRPADRVTAVEVDGESYRCGAVVIAGGAWSPEFARTLGVSLGVSPVRGQILHLRLQDTDTSSWPIAQPILGHYLVPWQDGRIAVGATVEAVGFDPRPTAAGMRQLFSETMRVAPGLSDATFVEVRVGLRPVSDDGLPILGPVPGVLNAHLATGYGADGLLLSPYCGRLVATLALGRTPELDLSAFAIARFGRA